MSSTLCPCSTSSRSPPARTAARRPAQHHRPGPAGRTVRLPPLLVRRAPPQPRRGRAPPRPCSSALIAAATGRIRVGSGAVQLGHRTALSSVEEFGLIDALHPGRHRPRPRPLGPAHAEAARRTRRPRPPRSSTGRVVDGLLHPAAVLLRRARSASPRFALSAALLQQPGAQPPDFAEQVDDILALLAGTYRSADGVEAHAVPGEGADVRGVDPGQQRRGERRRSPGRGACRSPPTTTSARPRVLEAVDGVPGRVPPVGGAGRARTSVVSADVVVADDDADGPRAGQPVRAVGAQHPHRRRARSRSRRPEEAARPRRGPTRTGRSSPDRVDTQFVGSPGHGRRPAANCCARPPAPTSCSSPPSPTTTPTGCAPTSCWPRSGPSPATPAGPDSTTARSPWPGRGPRIGGCPGRGVASRHRAEQPDLRAQVPSRPNAPEVGTPPSPWRAGLY